MLNSGTRTVSPWKLFIPLSAAFILVILPLFADASSGLARLTLTKGEVLLFDEESNDWVPAAANTPLQEGDRIWCAKGGRAEIGLKSGSILRLGSKTTIDIVRLDDDAQQVYLGSGRLYARTYEGDRDLQVDSEDATISVGRKSRVHVDLVGSGNPDTEVSVVKGTVYVESVSGKTRVRSGEALIFSENGAEVAPLNVQDEWEIWNESRDRKVFKRKAESRYLPEELVIYEDELASNGEWVTLDDYGYVWRPTVSIGADWVPYQQGRWVWRAGGYVWIASEPWGWAPHHYGRWQHSPRWGWCWVPPRRGDVFWSPGYVAWIDTPRDLAWVPLAPGEIYYGAGFYGSLSVNITTVDRRTIVRPITVYRNVNVRNAVTVIDRGAFASGKGKPRQGRPAGFERYQGITAPPQIRPSGREARMPQVRRVAPENSPPASIQQRHPSPLKERFPRLERERRSISSDRQTLTNQDRPKVPADRQHPAQQSVAPLPQPSRVLPAPQALQPTRVAPSPQTQPSKVPDKEQPGNERRRRDATQPEQHPTPITAEPNVRKQEKPAAADTRIEGRRGTREQQTQTESKPATPASRSEVNTVQQRRSWKIVPRETPKESTREILKDEKQGQREQKEQREQKPQRDR